MNNTVVLQSQIINYEPVQRPVVEQ